MADGYGCDGCDNERPVQWLLTNLAAGATLSVCGEDFPVMMVPLLAGIWEVDAGRLYEHIRKWVEREHNPPAARPPAKGRAKPPAADPPEPDPPEPDDDTGDQVDDDGGMSEHRGHLDAVAGP